MPKNAGAPPADSGKPIGGPIGREADTAALRRLLLDHRLVTVAGQVGVGKSSLAGFVTTGLHGRRTQVLRVRWPRTRPGRRGELTAAVLHAATGTARRPDAGAADLIKALRARKLLLYLDDIDPVRDEGVGLVQTLLQHLPKLRVLVTSRQPLGLGDEAVLRMKPLSTAPVEGDHGLAPAVRLFESSARAVREDFGAAGGDLDAVRDICRDLGGLPLAIELAAHQLAHHDVRDLAELVHRRQGWLAGPGMPLPRHRSLRRAIGSAYVLCDRTDRIVWARTSVFAASFDSAAAEFVCVGGSVAPHQVAVCLTRLAAAGILEPEGDPGGPNRPRYRMTPAARDFGAERLREADEFGVAAERHVMHCQRVAEAAEELWNTGSQTQAVQLVHDEGEELAIMLGHLPQHPEHAAQLLKAVVNLWFWWAVHDGGADLGLRCLHHLRPASRPDHPAALAGGWLAAWLTAPDDPQAAGELLRTTWLEAVVAGDDAALGRIAHVHGVLALYRGDLPAAAEHFHEAADTTPVDAPAGPSTAVSLAALAVAQAGLGATAARRTARRALSQPGLRGDTWASLIARYALALADYQQGRSGSALRRARRTLASLHHHWPVPHAAPALEQLIHDIETGRQARIYLPATATNRTDVPPKHLIVCLPCP
ncbi:ATP-binding protein [Streptomyces sp. NPDC057136]|uniref:ATP-binding protein n=1 Tax=Streptomyces sp. NPDC057136 TaxID=3346029 RepID=UPI00363DACEB